MKSPLNLPDGSVRAIAFLIVTCGLVFTSVYQMVMQSHGIMIQVPQILPYAFWAFAAYYGIVRLSETNANKLLGAAKASIKAIMQGAEELKNSAPVAPAPAVSDPAPTVSDITSPNS